MPKTLLEGLKHYMCSLADPANVAPMAAYMKNQFEFLGLKAPQRKEALRSFRTEYGKLEVQETWDLAVELWKLPEREYQQAAVDLLIAVKKEFRKTDIDKIEKLIVQKSWWDTVDFLSSHLAGSYFLLYPANAEGKTIKWITSDNLWLRRSALLFQLKYKSQTDSVLLYDYILRCADEQDFFIRKAIGWVLREYAKTDQKSVLKFVSSNQLSNLSRKEALKHIQTSI